MVDFVWQVRFLFPPSFVHTFFHGKMFGKMSQMVLGSSHLSPYVKVRTKSVKKFFLTIITSFIKIEKIFFFSFLFVWYGVWAWFKELGSRPSYLCLGRYGGSNPLHTANSCMYKKFLPNLVLETPFLFVFEWGFRMSILRFNSLYWLLK